MAEAMVFLSAVQATTQLVEQAFRILGRLRTAYQRQKALVEVLLRYERELNSIKAIIGIIEDYDDFHIPLVATELHQLREIQKKLNDFLKALDPTMKSKTAQFAHQLVQGSTDERKLAAIMDELLHVKQSLVLRIEGANVGVQRGIGKTLMANAIVIQRIDETLRSHVQDCEGLRIARILKGRSPSTEGLVALTRADLRKLTEEADSDDSSDETLVDDTDEPPSKISPRTERIILQNVTRDQALQINAPIGECIWKDIDRLEIKENVAEDQSIQMNHAQTMEVFLLLLERQKETIAVRPKKIDRKRQDTVVIS